MSKDSSGKYLKKDYKKALWKILKPFQRRMRNKQKYGCEKFAQQAKIVFFR